jgi:quercetin 2,3-dioxygenase
MDRKSFLKRSAAAAAALAAAPALGAAAKKTSEEKAPQVGFNHLPLKEIKTMNTVFHPASSRGHADHGWLKTYHSFSFAQYYNPERMHFGVLRVLNDDTIAGGAGFGRHPHDNMEIITIPLEGALEHQDSMGNKAVITAGEVQVMTAGTGIQHSEYNAHKDQTGRFLQIWAFPRARNLTPRYDQKKFVPAAMQNQWQLLVSPNPDDPGVWVNQDLWFNQTQLEKGKSLSYRLQKPGNGLYLFIIEGEAQVGQQKLQRRDALGMWDTSEFQIQADQNSHVLLMEIPMR